MKQVTTVEISLKSIVYTLALIVLALVAWKIKGVLIALFIAFILMSGFAPLVEFLTKNGVNKALSVALTYLLAISFLGMLFFFALPPLIQQTQEFVIKMPTYADQINLTFNSSQIPGLSSSTLAEIVSNRLDSALSNLLQLALNVFNIFITFITISVFTFYLLLEREKIKKNVYLLVPHLPRKDVENLAYKIEEKTGAWVRGQIVLMIIIGVFTYIGLTILGIEFALPLAVIAGLLEIVPVMGPIISSIPAIMIALVEGPILAIATIALYILIQQLENNLLVPKVMEKAVGLSPLITIFAILVGGTLFGIMGAVLAVPATAIGHVIVQDRFQKP